ISHILATFVAKMNEYQAPGQKVPTHHHPEGVFTQSRVLPLLADLAWKHRDGTTVKAQGIAWLSHTTIDARDKLFAETGVCWTPMHDLFGWDPVKHTVLGFMHNSLRGHGDEHLRNFWGIGRKSYLKQQLKEEEKEEKFSESDATEASEELGALIEE
ncbi:hypothetical protein C8F04DRAFT_925440, partial [Mycena alexandri]